MKGAYVILKKSSKIAIQQLLINSNKKNVKNFEVRKSFQKTKNTNSLNELINCGFYSVIWRTSIFLNLLN